MKESGIGHLESRWGSKYGIEEFLEVKYFCMSDIDRWLDGDDQISFLYPNAD
jgi:hypothetical protein